MKVILGNNRDKLLMKVTIKNAIQCIFDKFYFYTYWNHQNLPIL